MKKLICVSIVALAACAQQPATYNSDSGNTVVNMADGPSLAAPPRDVMRPPSGAAASTPPAQVAEAPAVPARADPPEPAAGEPTLAVEGDGLRWFLPPNGSARPLPFGTPKAQVLASLERVRGPAGKGTNQDCGAGPVGYASWPDGLSLVFQHDRFVGWGLDQRAAGALATANGVGPGTARRTLMDSFGSVDLEQTSLGTEFSAGGISGVFDGKGPSAKITDMWAGVSCVAR